MDVGEDKVELASRREHRSVWDIAAHYTNAFMRDVRELRVRIPSTWARATEHIEQMIAFARTLEDKGYGTGSRRGSTSTPAKSRTTGSLPGSTSKASGRERGSSRRPESAILRTSRSGAARRSARNA